jgi:predicted RNA-binding Zn-ribbon protein involved in translation (DUF1610 family)
MLDPKDRSKCSSCGADITDEYYLVGNNMDVIICPKCYENEVWFSYVEEVSENA